MFLVILHMLQIKYAQDYNGTIQFNTESIFGIDLIWDLNYKFTGVVSAYDTNELIDRLFIVFLF